MRPDRPRHDVSPSAETPSAPSAETHKNTHDMTREFRTTAPSDYPVCVHAQCPKADDCLHRMAYDMLLTRTDYMRLINPDHCTAADGCPYYRCGTPVRYARGFAGFQSHMYPQQYDSFKASLIRRFGRSSYYSRRSGEVAMTPEEQAAVLQALKRVGVTEKLTFDSYEDAVNWDD